MYSVRVILRVRNYLPSAMLGFYKNEEMNANMLVRSVKLEPMNVHSLLVRRSFAIW